MTYNNPLPEKYIIEEANLIRRSTDRDNVIMAKSFSAEYFFNRGNEILDNLENSTNLTSSARLEMYKEAFGFFEDTFTKIHEFEDPGEITFRDSELGVLRENKWTTISTLSMISYNISVLSQELETLQESIPYTLKAIDFIGKYRGFDSEKRILHNNIGFAYYKTDDFQKAIDALKESIELSKEENYPAPFRNIILAYIANENFKEAEEATKIYFQRFSDVGEVAPEELKKLRKKYPNDIVINISQKFKVQNSSSKGIFSKIFK